MFQVLNYSKKITFELRTQPQQVRDYLVCTYLQYMNGRSSIRPDEEVFSEKNILRNINMLIEQFPFMKEQEAREICQHRISHKLKKLPIDQIKQITKKIQNASKLKKSPYVPESPVMSQWDDELIAQPFIYSQMREMPEKNSISAKETQCHKQQKDQKLIKSETLDTQADSNKISTIHEGENREEAQKHDLVL